MLTLVGFFGFIIYDDGWDRVKEKMDKEHVVMGSLLVLSGPLGVFALLCAIFYNVYQDKTRGVCSIAMTKWEQKARSTTEFSHPHLRWEWYSEKNKELRYNSLREVVYCLTDKELKMLVSVEQGMFNIDQPTKEALVDEMLHRKILNHE
jgi:hypothetical protein